MSSFRREDLSLVIAQLKSIKDEVRAVGGIRMAHLQDLALAVALLENVDGRVDRGGSGMTTPLMSMAEDLSQISSVAYLLEAVPAWLWQSDAQHKFTYVSPQFEKLTGIGTERFVGRTRAYVMESEISTPVNVKMHDAILAAREPLKNWRYELKAPSDQTYSVSIFGWPIYNQEGIFAGYIGIGIDVSDDRIKLLEMVEARVTDIIAEHTLFGDAMNALDVSVLIIDENGYIEYFNPRWAGLHKAMRREDCSRGVLYEHYLRAAVALQLFPDALKDEETYIQWRLKQNKSPEPNPFKVGRQDGIVLSIYVAQLTGGKTAIFSTEISRFQ